MIQNIHYQDNKSTILLEENGRKSAGKCSRALNIRYFFVTDQITQGNLTIEFCPTERMTADFYTKPLQGEPFRKFKAELMGQVLGMPVPAPDRSVLEELNWFIILFIYLAGESLMGLNQLRCRAGSIYLQWSMMYGMLSDKTHVLICVWLIKETTHMERSDRGLVVNVPGCQ